MELLDVYDNEGNVTGRTIIRGDKSAILNENEHIAVAVIFIENSKGEYLIQKTSKEKGGLFSSTGGHVDSGETPKQAIQREVKEELGIEIKESSIQEFGHLLYDKPIRYLFYLKEDIDTNKIVYQKEEVDSVEYMNLSEIEKLISKKEMLESHGILFHELLKRKEENK